MLAFMGAEAKSSINERNLTCCLPSLEGLGFCHANTDCAPVGLDEERVLVGMPSHKAQSRNLVLIVN